VTYLKIGDRYTLTGWSATLTLIVAMTLLVLAVLAIAIALT